MTPSSSLAFVLLAACEREVELLAPSPGGEIGADLSALVVSVDRTHRDAPVTTLLDGEDVTDALGLVRARSDRLGGGFEYLAVLDLRDAAPGEHALEVRFRGATDLVARGTFRFAPPPCRLELTARDALGPTSARVVLVGPEGPLDLGGAGLDPRGRDDRHDSVFVVEGRGSARVPCGPLRLIAFRDVRDHLDVQDVDVGEHTRVDLLLRRAVETPGELSADLHVHTGRSGDSVLPDRLRFDSLAAAGLDVVVTTDHDAAFDPSERLARALAAPPTGVAGIEATLHVRERAHPNTPNAHVNAFPVPSDLVAPPEWVDSPAETIASLRGGGAGLVQLNHPRGIQFAPDEEPESAWALFAGYHLDRDVALGEGANAWTAVPGALDFDALEVVNRFSWPLYLSVREDWFALLDAGVSMTGTGNSDSHAAAVELAGLPTNLVALGGRFDSDAFVAAIRDGRVRVTSGPIVSLDVGGVAPGHGIATGRRATVRVQAAPWVPVAEVRLVVNGDVVARWDPPPPHHSGLDVTFAHDLALEGDAWVLAEAGWPLDRDPDPAALGLYALVAPGYAPIGFTNPVRVDADADGAWKPPGR